MTSEQSIQTRYFILVLDAVGEFWVDKLHVPTATVGNVKTARPGIWDMLGRAKWCVQHSGKAAEP
jgi:hypothetical protein